MATWVKHRLEDLSVSVDFTKKLPTGVTLTGTPTILVGYHDGAAWIDVTSEFSAVLVIDAPNNRVNFTLSEAGVGEQVEQEYTVFVACPGTDGNTYGGSKRGPDGKAMFPTLHVSGAADTSAP